MEVRSHSSYTRMYDVVEMACAAFFIVEPRRDERGLLSFFLVQLQQEELRQQQKQLP